MEFLGLKIFGALAGIGILYYLYRKYRSELTASALLADFEAGVTKLETWADNTAKSLEAKIAQKLSLENDIAAVQAEVQKVKDFVAKIKALF